ncbi:MAG: CinA family nicotinamide mononucleotide deamidase-related protein, partial [Candidatus Omnitrophota bacterium]|nr:CinA family nicotinamide mononucleotide deamidase-related protein [Candidatus Omnitrophota bacterium]
MEIQAHIICIGNEIMLGHINNTNAQYLSKKLSEIGIRTTKQTSIPDEAKTIISSINNSLNSSNITVLTGGLGPTVDDLTLECISKASGKGLIFNKKVATNIKAHFKKRKIKMPKNNLRQALVPKDANYILNDIGTAPGLFMTLAKGKVLIALPGVPFELYSMFKKGIVPQLKKIFQPDKIIRSRVIKLTGLAESSVDSKIEDLLRSKGNVEMGIYPHPEEISIKITATDETEKKARATIAKIEKKIYSRLKNHIFGYDDETLEGAVGKILLKKKLSLSIAESCTGGLLASRITD